MANLTRWANGVFSNVINSGLVLASHCRLSVCDAVHCGAQGRCRGLIVVPSRSKDGTSYSLLQTHSEKPNR